MNILLTLLLLAVPLGGAGVFAACMSALPTDMKGYGFSEKELMFW